jgi:D-alanine-D-alanine ligase-like ATP-grasp enzyme/acylphosphatase
MKNNNWLSHLEGAVPTSYGNRLSMYLIALEAWRRGLTVRFFSIDNPKNKLLIRYALSYRGREHSFESSMGDKLTDRAFNICKDKDETKRYLLKEQVPVPDGKRFDKNDSDLEIINYASLLGYPVVLKPRSENAGKGVISNINNEQKLKRSLKHVREELKYKNILVEKFISGTEYRILIIDGKIISAVNRIPANIIGDGVHSIETLIDLKNKSRKDNPALAKKDIKIDNEIMNSIELLGYNLTSVPDENEHIYLRTKSNISAGGDTIDVTEELTEELRDIAIKAVHAIPDLDICGLDMIVDRKRNKGVVIEINTKPMIGLHLFPIKGKARDVVKPIIDYYFPETKDRKKTTLYFDFDTVLAPFRGMVINDLVMLSPPSLDTIYAKKYIVTGEFSWSAYRVWIRKKALENHMHGYTRKSDSGKKIVVVAGLKKEVVDRFIDTCYQGPGKEKIKEIKEFDMVKPVKIGFRNR